MLIGITNPKGATPPLPAAVSHKVLLEHHFQCFLPVPVTSCDRPQLEAVPGGLPAARQQGALHRGFAGPFALQAVICGRV